MFSEKYVRNYYKYYQVLLLNNYVENNLLLSYSVLKNRFQQHLDIYKVNMDQVLLFPCVIKQFSFLIFSKLSQINRGSKNH